jgi:hypothetical protein
LASAELATTIHVGAHLDIDGSYGALGTYVAEHALGIEGPIASTTSSIVSAPTKRRSGAPRSAGRSSTPQGLVPAAEPTSITGEEKQTKE